MDTGGPPGGGLPAHAPLFMTPGLAFFYGGMVRGRTCSAC